LLWSLIGWRAIVLSTACGSLAETIRKLETVEIKAVKGRSAPLSEKSPALQWLKTGHTIIACRNGIPGMSVFMQNLLVNGWIVLWLTWLHIWKRISSRQGDRCHLR
jgi:hypothetical protein